MSISRANQSGISIGTSATKTKSLAQNSGLPGPVQSLTATATGNKTATLSWSAPTISGVSSVTSYSVSGGGSITVTGTSASITNLTANTSYTFTVTAVNSLGSGKSVSATPITTFNFNEASGGTETTVTNYNGTGQTWKVHTFSSNGTLNITRSSQPFRYLICGGGSGAGSEFGSATYGGNVSESSSWSPSTGSHSVVRGNGGAGCTRPGDWTTACTGSPGGASSLSGISASGGTTSNTGLSNKTSNISGSNYLYGSNSYTGGYGSNGDKGGYQYHPEYGTAGTIGVVIVSYRIA